MSTPEQINVRALDVDGHRLEAGELRLRLNLIENRIVGAGGDRALVKIVAVTKGFSADAVRLARSVGLSDIGENYADELVEKYDAVVSDGLTPPLRWHFLGPLQRNKVSKLSGRVTCYQGIDRIEEGEALARAGRKTQVLIEVDTQGLRASARAGVRPDDVERLAVGLFRLGLDVRGLMTIAPIGGPEVARRSFEMVSGLVERLHLEEASMGMSDDLELAVAAGSTMIRIGRALFGERGATIT